MTNAKLQKRRENLFKKIQSMKPELLRGSLIERYKKCGKPGCKCATGPGHGPKYYLSISVSGKRPEMIYVPQDYVKKVENYLGNLGKVRELIEKICKINTEFLRNKEEF